MWGLCALEICDAGFVIKRGYSHPTEKSSKGLIKRAHIVTYGLFSRIYKGSESFAQEAHQNCIG